MYFLIGIIGILLIVITGLFFKLRKRKLLASSLAITVILLTVALYSLWSEIPGMFYADITGAPSPESESIEDIEEHLNARGGTIENWVMLARIYMGQQRTDDAVRIFAKAESIGDLPISAMLEYAQARFVHNQQTIDDKTQALITTALHLEPENLKALWWSGFMNYTKQDYQMGGNRMDQITYSTRKNPTR